MLASYDAITLSTRTLLFYESTTWTLIKLRAGMSSSPKHSSASENDQQKTPGLFKIQPSPPARNTSSTM